MTPRSLALALALGLPSLAGAGAGCGSDDPFTADMKLICAAGNSGGEHLPPDMRRIAGMKDIAKQIQTAEAARLVTAVVRAAPAERGGLLKPALKKAGLSRCAFLER